MDTIDISVLVEEYVEDAFSHLDAVEKALMELEKKLHEGQGDEKVLTQILGNLHTLKGNSGMMGLVPLQQFIHKVESLVKDAAEGTLNLSSTILEAFYAAVNAIREGLRKLAENPAEQLDFSDELMLLECLEREEALKDCAGNDLLGLESCAGNKNEFSAARKDDYNYLIQKSNTLKVKFEKLDELMNLVGELVIHRTALVSLQSKFRETVKDRALLEALDESGLAIGKTANDLREAIMKVRMLPINRVFQRFNRLVRDLSRSHGKEVNLVFEGDETELDKTIIDEIGEPLLHLIRNSLDHGIETPAERRRQGKPATATLTLRAGHESNHIVIAVEDDGRGMVPGHLRESAAAKGLISAQEAREMSDQEALQLIFLPGFSTSREVTEISGRGIGLDVVKKIVASFNGTIDIESLPGLYTRFTLKLPLTLAIIQSLMVEVSGETFAVPLSAVLESLKVDAAGIHEVGAGEMIRLRDRLLPIIRLDRFFALEIHEERTAEYVVVVGSGEKRGGLVVDRLIGQQEIVIKAMDDYLGELAGIAGGTVLGDGKVSLIIDIASLLDSAKRGGVTDGKH